MNKKKKIPDPTVERLPLYFRCLNEMKGSGISIVSSEEIAGRCGIKASQFRKDLSYFGEFGIQGLGYPVEHLLGRISALMQLNRQHTIVILGAGNLGIALAKYGGFARWGFEISHIYDVDPQKVGSHIGNSIVENAQDMPEKMGAELGVIAVPSSKAQEAASKLMSVGIKAILNFTGAKIEAPPDVIVRNVDLTHELAILNYYLFSGGHK